MKQKAQVKEYINKAMELLKKQVLNGDELKARSMLSLALNYVDEAEDEDGPKSGAV
jgi:hypothetical protein